MIYPYECKKCGLEIDVQRSVAERDVPPYIVVEVPSCKEGVHEWVRVPARTSFTLKGTGWYRDGYGG